MVMKKDLNALIDSIGNIGELNLILTSLQESPLEKWIVNSYLLRRTGICANIPIPENLINLAIELNLIELKYFKGKKIISLTNSGKKLLKLGYVWEDRFSEQQGEYLLTEIVKKAELFQAIIILINMFHCTPSNDLYLNCKDKRLNPSSERILRIFQQMKIAEYHEGNIMINKEKKVLLADAINMRSIINEGALLKILKRKEENGLIAEEFVLNCEKERLKKYGREDLSKLVKRISEYNVLSGYDILSFDGVASKDIHDRFIEVKGTFDDEIVFFITKNELEIAKKLKKQYWIYHVVNVNNEDMKEISITISNPYKILFKSGDFEVEPILWKIRLLNNDKYRSKYIKSKLNYVSKG